MSYFSSNYSRINYPILTDKAKGLRNAQLGATYAIGSHFTLYAGEPALVVMPTGSGKTAVLNLAPYLLRANRVLVISSTILVRGQIVDEFTTLRTLKESNVFHQDLVVPRIKEIKSPIKTLEQWEALKAFDVVVGIPNSINEGITEGIAPPTDLFDLVLVDEAHHVPAFTWTNIVRHFDKARKVFFTATPFRRDKKEIEGRLIFYYPLTKAYEDKIFGDIGYYPVITASPNTDIAIALQTEKIFIKDKEAGFKHFVMVRTESKDHAEVLSKLYSEKTSLNLKKVDSTQTYQAIKKTIAKLKAGQLDGIICVDMLGEGFDFPNLKIAAIHSPKKSLANTLQFIGRFARTNAENIGEAKFLAIPNDIEIGKRRLYEEGAIWNDIIKNLSEEIIVEEDEIKTVLDTFDKEKKSSAKDISFYNLNPYCHVKVYKADGINLDSIINVPGQEILYHGVSKEHNSAIFILQEKVKPKWIASDDLIDVNHFFILVYYDETTKLLFIHSSIKTNQFYDELVNTFAAGDFERISKFQINKVLVDISDTEFFNIGMQNRSANSGESYRIIAGPNAEKTIRKSHGKNYANGHVFMKGLSEGEKITIGYSTGSKVWSNSYQRIPNYIKWCSKIGQKIISNKEVKTNTGFDNLPIGRTISTFPLPAHSATWHGDTFTETPFLNIRNEDEILSTHQLLDFEITLIKSKSSTEKLTLKLTLEDVEIPLVYNFENHFQYEIPTTLKYLVETSAGNIDLIEYLNENSLTIFLDDFAAIIDHDFFEPPKEEFQYDLGRILSHDWVVSNTDITKEFYESATDKTANGGKNSIHETLATKLTSEGNDVVIYDHGSGEIADFITLKEFHDRIEVNLYHIKGSSGTEPGDRVKDVYEVCMQAVKSQSWTTNKTSFRKKIASRTADKIHKFMVGSPAQFDVLTSKAKRIQNHFTIIQPGISKDSISPKLSHILAAADDSIQNNGNEPLVIFGS
jgi:superfamily II DNA or RNA helicase